MIDPRQDRCPGVAGQPRSRRELLKTASNGFGYLALSALLADRSYGGLSGAVGPHFTPRAKNVILLFMPGGVSHMDSFDPKPKLADLDGKPAKLDNYAGIFDGLTIDGINDFFGLHCNEVKKGQ